MTWVDDLVHDALLDWPDADGRFLGEQAAEAYSTLELDTRACPVAGTRLGEPTNVGALAQVTRHHASVCSALRSASGPTAGDAWLATCRLRFAPFFAPRPPSAVDAACFKTALGLNRPLTSWLLLTPGAAKRPLEALVSVDALVPRLASEGWLHGSRQVCPASPELLRTSWASLVAPGRSPHVADPAAVVTAGLWASLGRLRALIRDGELSMLPGWSPVARPDARWPRLAHLLAGRGPGALVREVPRFEPDWALHVFAVPPPSLLQLVGEVAAAGDVASLQVAWDRFEQVVTGG